MEHEAIYVADPMCSWCWGFAPASSQLAQAIAGRAKLRVVPGGLSIGTRTPLLPGEAEQIVGHWRHVAEASGQPFDFDHPVDHTTVYDSGPSCQALSLMNLRRPQASLDYLHALQRAFYAERRDLSDTEVLAECAERCALTRAEFEQHYEQAETRAALEADLDLVHDLGIQGYPAVALRSDQRIQMLKLVYRAWPELHP